MADFSAIKFVTSSDIDSQFAIPAGIPAHNIASDFALLIPGDTTAPTISNMIPTPGDSLARYQPVSFDVLDESALRRVMILVRHLGEILVAHDGDTFINDFGTRSTRTVISGGFHYVLLPESGWLTAPRIEISAIDTGGNEAS